MAWVVDAYAAVSRKKENVITALRREFQVIKLYKKIADPISLPPPEPSDTKTSDIKSLVL